MLSNSPTPMMSQFLKIKSRYDDSLLFYRMGDFYELFFEDAEIASAALNITLTKRGKHNGKDIPMCGVPCHSSENYLLNLIRKGYKVAVCEQLENPEEAKKRGYKSIVKRDVVRLITPGTLTEDGLLSKGGNNFLLSIIESNGAYGASWADISTGEFYCSNLDNEGLISLINRILPSEILIPINDEEKLKNLNLNKGVTISVLPSDDFNYNFTTKYFEKYFENKSAKIFAKFDINEVSAIGALLSYLEITQCGQTTPLREPTRETKDLYLKIDAASRKSLEITQTLDGSLKGSLLGTINKTLTSGGARLLKDRLNCPSINLTEIKSRQKAVGFFIENQFIMTKVRDILKHTPDMQRSLSRLGLNRGGPKDLSIIRNSLRSTTEIQNVTSYLQLPELLYRVIEKFKNFEMILLELNQGLIENPPHSVKEGSFICSNYSEKLKDFRNQKKDSQKLIAQLQLQYIKITKVNSLKIKYNNVLGYFIETPVSQLEKMNLNNLSETFFHRQTTTNSSRFSSLELSKLANDIINAQEQSDELEVSYYKKILVSVLNKFNELNSAAQSLSELDLYSSLSFLSIASEWKKPKIDKSKTFKITQGRHPVVEAALKSTASDDFISNNCDLSTDKNSILLITGPNMAGKSTFLRQNALITILAQIGSDVPASKAHIGIVDQIFSRVGASDDLAKGNSTFMVEMIETADILENATESSLIIMDEIGRGTATYDGLSIAWATLEHIHNVIECRTLFATHYHELTQLEDHFSNIKNAKVAIREWMDDVIFLHEVKFGTADKSYGIQVAKIAGLPKTVTKRANEILEQLERTPATANISSSTNSTDPTKYVPNKEDTEDPLYKRRVKESLRIFDMLNSLNTDDISPREALNILDETVLITKLIE